MLKGNSLINDEECSSGLYYSFYIVFIVIFSVIFAAITATIGVNQNLAEKDLYILLSFTVSPIAAIVLTLLFVYVKGGSLLEISGLKKCEKKYYIIAIVAFATMLLGLGNLNTIFVGFLSKKFGYIAEQMVLPEFSVGNYFLVVLTVCILPAITEEIAMRGVVLRGIKSGNLIANAILGGLLFSLFHMNPMQTPYQFAVGFVFSIIAIKSRSTIPTIVAHFLNNFAIVTTEYFCPNLFANLGACQYAIIVPAFVGLVALVVFIIKDGSNTEKVKKDCLKNFFMGALAGIFICTFMWTMAFLG